MGKLKAPGMNSRCNVFVMGWMMGLEPTNAGTTNRCVNHFATPTIRFELLVRLERFEPPTSCLEGRCSIQLSYRRKDYGRQPRLPFQPRKLGNHGRGRGIRTPGLLVPNQAR